MKLSLCVIAKDEEENIPRCLNSVREVVDEVIVVDTGSTDHTPDIAASYGAKVVHFPWTGSFAEARNISIQHARGDWILWLDADEALAQGDGPELRRLLEDPSYEAYYLHVLNFIGDEPRDGEVVVSLSPRLFRRRPGYLFTRSIHEQIIENIRRVNPQAQIGFSQVRIFHYGYLRGAIESKHKINRNLNILLQEVRAQPEDPFTRFNLALEYMRRRDYAKAVEEFRAAFQRLSSLDASYAPFLLKNLGVCLKELQRYPDALRVLTDAQEAFPDYTDLEFVKGLVYLDMMDYPSATQSFLKCVEMGEAPAQYITQQGLGTYHAWAMIGLTCKATNAHEQAVQAFAKALQSNPREVTAVKGLAEILLSREDVSRVCAFFERTTDLSDPDVLVAFADTLNTYGFPEEALSYLDQHQNALSPRGDLSLVRGQSLLRLHRYQEAWQAFAQIKPQSRYYVQGQANAVVAGYLAGDPSLVRISASRVYQAGYADFAAVYEALACLLGGAKTPTPPSRLDTALDAVRSILGGLLLLQEFTAFEQALPLVEWLKLGPAKHLELGKLYISHGFQETALEELIQAHEAGAIDAEGYRILGKLAEGKELWEDAVVFYRKALEMDEQNLPTYTALVQALARLKQYSEALDVLEEGQRIFPHARILEEARKALVVVVGDAR
ncbi:MAG: glycosyltransferase [Thermofilaceae archaeon]